MLMTLISNSSSPLLVQPEPPSRLNLVMSSELRDTLPTKPPPRSRPVWENLTSQMPFSLVRETTLTPGEANDPGTRVVEPRVSKPPS